MKRSSLAPSTKPMKRTPLRATRPAKTSAPIMGKCRHCKAPFERKSARHIACSPACIIALTEKSAAKKLAAEAKRDRIATKQKLIEIKPLKWFKAKAKKALHLFVRTRDEGKPCASCDTILRNTGKPGGDYDAGHFRSVGSAKHLEMDLRNIWGQCKHCNHQLSGNSQEYERRLRISQGDAFVDELLSDNETRRYRREDYLVIEAWAKKEMKELKSGKNKNNQA